MSLACTGGARETDRTLRIRGKSPGPTAAKRPPGLLPARAETSEFAREIFAISVPVAGACFRRQAASAAYLRRASRSLGCLARRKPIVRRRHRECKEGRA